MTQQSFILGVPPKFVASATMCSKRGRESFFRSAAAISSVSEDDAREHARALALSRAEAAAKGGDAQSEHAAGEYPYADRVLVEPVLERVTFGNSADAIGETQELGRITRNRYAASVLNTYNILFADVDTITKPSADNQPHYSRTITTPKPPVAATAAAAKASAVSEAAALDALSRVVRDNPELGFRVYATRAGLRYLCVTRLFDPVSAETQDLFQRLHADPLYKTLCRVQKCFRARLTPKLWRCWVVSEKPAGFFARLFGITRRTCEPARFSVCRYMDTIGAAQATLPEIQRIVEIHDAATGVGSGKPLA